MNLFLCASLFLDDVEKIANIIIAFLTLVLGYYVFVYQRRKDNKDRKIQWFKDLVIQPRLHEITKFFDGISTLKTDIKSNDLTEEEKVKLISDIKRNASNFRKELLSIIQHLAPDLSQKIQDNIDKLIDDITIAVANDELKLCNEKTFEREIGKKIQDSYSYVLKQIFEYNG